MTAAALSETGNERIAMGANRGPFDIVAGEIELLYAEAKNWADGKGIESDDLEAIKDALDTLDKALLKAGQEVEAIRKELVKPLDEAKDEIQALAHPLIGDTKAGKGKVVLARAALNKIRTEINQKIAANKAAAAALAEAERQAELEALRTARAEADGSLEAEEQISQLESSVAMAGKVAKTAEKAAQTGNGLRTVRTLKITDTRALAGWLWKHRREDAEAAHAEVAQRIFRNNGPAMDGTEIETTQKAI
jgi:DNA polymerase III alpha subunit (gram-positive type)